MFSNKTETHRSNVFLGIIIGKILLVFASPTGYMFTPFGFFLLHWGIFFRFF